jgi:hypothetical protein
VVSGAGTGTGVTSAVAVSGSSAVAAAGVLAGKIGLKDLDFAARKQLNAVRVSLELFFDATTRLGAS